MSSIKKEYDAILITDTPTMGFSRYAGVYKVASELRKNGYKCLVVDCFLEFSIAEIDTLFKLIISSKTLFVGFSSTFLFSRFKANGSFLPRKFALFEKGDRIFPLGRPQEEIVEIIKLARNYNSNLKMIIGGSAISRNHNIYANYGFDYFFEKEADVSIVEFANRIRREQVDQIIYTDINSSKLIRSLDYPYKEFNHSSIQWEDSDLIEINEALPIEIARGCIFRCKFCDYNMNGKKINDYIRSEESIRNEMMYNFSRFGTTKYLFTDDLINDSVEKLDMLERVVTSLPFKIEWSSYARLDLIWRYPQMAKQLLNLGAKFLLFGIETLNDKSGLAVGKGLGKTKTLDTLELCYKTWGDQVYTASGFIIGLPNETKESVKETFQWLTSENCPLTKATFTAYIIESSYTDQSEISKDHERFGYSLYEKNGRKLWKNEYMSSEEAQQLMIEFNNAKSTKFSFMESGFYHRFSNLNSKIDFLGPRNFSIFDFHLNRRIRYKKKLINYLESGKIEAQNLSS